jgi:hypothetical protein
MTESGRKFPAGHPFVVRETEETVNECFIHRQLHALNLQGKCFIGGTVVQKVVVARPLARSTRCQNEPCGPAQIKFALLRSTTSKCLDLMGLIADKVRNGGDGAKGVLMMGGGRV